MTGLPRHGRNAAIFIDTSTLGTSQAVQISSKAGWSYDQSVDFVDTTSFGDQSKNAVPGLPNGAGSITGFWDSGDNLVYNLIGDTVQRRLYIYPDLSNNATSYIAARGYFSAKSGGSTTTAVSFDLDFTQGSLGGGWVHP